MPDEEDYYRILDVASDASTEQIREAYIYKVNILHPDRLAAMPERIRRLAEEDLKKVNIAYSVLSNPDKRRQYNLKRFGSTEVLSDSQRTRLGKKPRPEVYPKAIRFDKCLPYTKQKGSFFVRNVGGPFEKVLISKTPQWVRVVQTTSLQDYSKLPMRVDIEANGIQWGKIYRSEIVVRLDENETKVEVALRTQKKPR